jgi:hypothetical protein
MGGVRAHHLSHRDRLTTRAAELDCDGIGRREADAFHRRLYIAGANAGDARNAGIDFLELLPRTQ